MVTYRLIATNVVNDEEKILLQEKKLSKLDEFIYRNFSTLDSVASYFNIISDSEFSIKFIYNNNPRYLDLILNVGNYNFLDIIKSVDDNKIDKNSKLFIQIYETVLKNYSKEQLWFLVQNGYISKRIHDFILEYRNYDYCKNDERIDKADLYYQIKSELSRYITFRRLYSGIQQLNAGVKPNIKPSAVAKTDDSLINDLFNNGDLDSVYSTYDIDDLRFVDGVESLEIDGINLKKK